MPHTRVTRVEMCRKQKVDLARARLKFRSGRSPTFARSRREEENERAKGREERMNKESKSSKAWAEKASKVLLRIPRASVSFTAT